MRFFITVGTTPFDDLIKTCDKLTRNFVDTEFIAQISNGSYEPSNMNYFSFTDDINSFYSNSDLIICHSGAGTVYRLLELGKKVLIVPNLDRREDHQLELCKFVETNNFGLVAYNLNDLEKLIKRALFFKTRVYSKDEELLLAKDINRLIMKYYNR